MRSPVEERGSSCSSTSRSCQRGEQLLDPHHRDQRRRQRRAHAAVALGLDDADGPGLGDREVRAADADATRAGTRSRRCTRAASASAAGSSDRSAAAERARGRDRGSRCGCGGSRGRGCATALAGELHDQLGEVGLDRLDPAASSASLSPISSVVSDLTLTTSRAPSACDELGHDPVGLGARRAPSAPARRPPSRPPRVARGSDRGAAAPGP